MSCHTLLILLLVLLQKASSSWADRHFLHIHRWVLDGWTICNDLLFINILLTLQKVSEGELNNMHSSFVNNFFDPEKARKMQMWNVFFILCTSKFPASHPAATIVWIFLYLFRFISDVTVLPWWGALWCFAWLSALPCLDLVRKEGISSAFINAHSFLLLSFFLLLESGAKSERLYVS